VALDLAAEQAAEQLHAVADPEHGDAELEDARIDRRGPLGVDARGPPGEDDRLRLELAHTGELEGAGVDLAEDVLLADAPRDELGVLRAEVEDEDCRAGHGARQLSRAPRRRHAERARRGAAPQRSRR